VSTSTIGLYYYTRIVVAMYVQQPLPADAAQALPPVAATAGRLAGPSTLAVVVAVVLFFGVYPAPLIRLLEHVVAGLP
jgi:NADH:ubiquinone oxidoreductase subunit 2 (subunit N)